MKHALGLTSRRVVLPQKLSIRLGLFAALMVVISPVLVWRGGFAFESSAVARSYRCTELAGMSWDLGPWNCGEPKTFPVRIRNDDEQRLIVYLLKRDCCGERIAQSITIESQESGEIWVEIEPQREPGSFRRAIRFYTSEPNLPKFDLWIQGVVQKEPAISRAATHSIRGIASLGSRTIP